MGKAYFIIRIEIKDKFHLRDAGHAFRQDQGALGRVTSLTLEAKQESGACGDRENKLSKDCESPNSRVGSNLLSISRGIWFTGINPFVRISE